MSLLAAASRPLYGAFRLARFDPEGVSYFDDTPAAFWFSFFAAVLCFPLYLLLIGASWLTMIGDVSMFRFATVHCIGFVMSWAILPNILPIILTTMDRDHLFIRGVVAYNWASVLKNLVYVPVATIGILGVQMVGFLTFLILILVLVYTWYVLKNVLEITGSQASIIVILDLVISLFLGVWTDSLIFGS